MRYKFLVVTEKKLLKIVCIAKVIAKLKQGSHFWNTLHTA